MKTIILEVRDHGTFIPVVAVLMFPASEEQRFLLAMTGYPCADISDAHVVIFRANGDGYAYSDPYSWGASRTMQVAHDYILRQFKSLKDGDVVDVAFILGETTEPKKSERGS